jgi:hypothetical protein
MIIITSVTQYFPLPFPVISGFSASANLLHTYLFMEKILISDAEEWELEMEFGNEFLPLSLPFKAASISAVQSNVIINTTNNNNND